MSLRILLSLIIMLAGVLLGMSLASPEVYAAPKVKTPQVVMFRQPPAILTERPTFKSEYYDRYFYEPLILRPQIEQLIAKYNANVTKIERLTAEEREQVIDAIIARSKVYDLDPLLVASVIAAESSFRIRDRWGRALRSGCGAIGLMQVMPYHGWRADLTTIAGNIDTGCWYIRLNMDRTPNVKVAVAAYNAGPKRPEWAMRHHPETKWYVPRVMGIYEGLRGSRG